MVNESFIALNDNELMEVDGGIPWLVVGIGAACVVAFGIGVYNGYKGNS